MLTDKTGTLTENCMEFRTCSINGIKYVEENDTLMRAMDNSAIHLQRIEEFTVISANIFKPRCTLCINCLARIGTIFEHTGSLSYSHHHWQKQKGE